MHKSIVKYGILFILPIIVIHVLFKFSLGLEFFESTWESGDLLNYTASFYILLCTVIIAKNQESLLSSQNKIQEEQVKIQKRQNEIEWYSRAIDINLDSIVGTFDEFTLNLECDKKNNIQNINFKEITFKGFNAGNIYFDEKENLTHLNTLDTVHGWTINIRFNIHAGNKFEDSDICLIYDYINSYNDTYKMEMHIRYDWVQENIKKISTRYCDEKS